MSGWAQARRYQQLMWFPVIVSFCATIIAFYGAILIPLQPTWLPPPSATVFALLFLCAFVSLVSMVLFCCCMQKYCEAMNWERPFASWLFSAKMTSRGVLFPFMILAIPMFMFLTSLEFEFIPKESRTIIWNTEWLYGERNRPTAEHDFPTSVRLTAHRNGMYDKVIRSEIVPVLPDGSYNRPKLGLPENGARLDYGEWVAPIKGVFARSVMLLFVLLFLVFFCAVIHFLVSLSRTIYAAQEPRKDTTESEPQV